MRYDSCRQCTKRRIVCDQGAPRCRKCVKKGIACSGVGKEYRFVVAATSRKTRREPPSSVRTASGAYYESSGDHQQRCVSSCPQPPIVEDESRDQEGQDRTLSMYKLSDVCRVDLESIPLSRVLHGLGPSQRMLFDHFSTVIAPYMVAFDADRNGYRDLILPFACHDPLVQRAVSVVSAFHLSSQQPNMRRAAEMGRTAILTKLREDALSGSEAVFTLSTWTTLIILLVGETVTGSSDFVHLFTMLQSVLKVCPGAPLGSPSLSKFLSHQSQMFQLLTPPLLGASQPAEPWGSTPDQFFGFLAPSPLVEHLHYSSFQILKEAFQLAYTLSIKRNAGSLSDETSLAIIQQLKVLLLPMEKSMNGAHSLAWVYFMAAAESRTVEDRKFFSRRLYDIHKIGDFGNILVALQTLEHIWSTAPQGRLTRNKALIAPVLII